MKKNCEMIIAGFGGQGILFAGKILAYAAMLAHKHLSWLPSYGPEMRGGTANCHVIISDEPVGSPIVTQPDMLIVMNKPSLDKFEDEVQPGGKIFVDATLIDRKIKRTDVAARYISATQIAVKMGQKKLANMVMVGRMLKETGLFTLEQIKTAMDKCLPTAELAKIDMEAVEAGFYCMS